MGRPSGCISLCVMGICLPRPLVGWLRGVRARRFRMLIRGRCGVLNQVVRGNSGPGGRETLAGL